MHQINVLNLYWWAFIGYHHGMAWTACEEEPDAQAPRHRNLDQPREDRVATVHTSQLTFDSGDRQQLMQPKFTPLSP